MALKIINPATIANQDAGQRFLREARIAAQLRHPNIASVFRLGTTGEGAHYYAMEFCEGNTLQQLVERSGPIDCRRALQFTLQVTKALIVAEERHLVHRDLKPSNLIVTQRTDEGEVIKVIDFGLAKTTTPEGTMWSSMGTQGFIGTAHFASPEQIEDKPVDTRSDIYSLGSTLWFMLMGKPPFEGSLARIMSQHLTMQPDYSRLHGVPEKVITLLRRMLEKNAEDRPQTALELRREIIECLEIAGPKERAEEAKAPAPAVESPPPQKLVTAPPAEAPAPWTAWAPSLLDLLRVRSVLLPAEAFRIGDVLAAKIDTEADSPAVVLRLQDITIHFYDSPTTAQARARIREQPTEWPAFALRIDSGDPARGQEPEDPSQTMTVIRGEEFTGDRAQQLARLLYELMGGVSGSRYVPLARLGEGGNEVLQRVTNAGLAAYPTLGEFMGALRGAHAMGPAPSISASVRSSPSQSSRPKSPPSAAAHPLPESVPQVPADLPKPPEPAQAAALADGNHGSQGSHAPGSAATVQPPPLVAQNSTGEPGPPPLPPKPPPEQIPVSKKGEARRSFRWGTALKIIAVLAGVGAIFEGVKTFRSGMGDGRAGSQNQPHSSSPVQARTPAAPLQFAIFDKLGAGLDSETVSVFLDEQIQQVASITLTPREPLDAAVINLPAAGHHVIRIRTESVVSDPKNGQKRIISLGHWETNLRGGEKFDLAKTPRDDGDSYQLEVNVRDEK